MHITGLESECLVIDIAEFLIWVFYANQAPGNIYERKIRISF